MNLEIHPATSRQGPGKWVRDGTEKLLKAARLQRVECQWRPPPKTNLWEVVKRVGGRCKWSLLWG